MLVTQKALSVLEFDKIRETLSTYAPTEGAREKALSLLPSEYYDVVVKRQTETADARRMINCKGYPPFVGDVGVADAVGRTEKGAPLSPRELMMIASVLRGARLFVEYIEANRK